MKLVLTGAKCSGKSALGALLAEKNGIKFYETDVLIEELFFSKHKVIMPCRAICAEYGEDYFRELEKEVVNSAALYDNCIISTGGSTLLNKTSRQLLRNNSIIVLFKVSADKLIERLKSKNIPAYLLDRTAIELFSERASLVNELLYPFADITIDSSDLDIGETYQTALNEIYSHFLRGKNSLPEDVKFLGKTSDSNYAFGITGDLNIAAFEKSVKNTFSIDLKAFRLHRFLVEIQISSKDISSLSIADKLPEQLIENDKEFFIISKLLSKFLISGEFSECSNCRSLLKFILC